MLAASLTAIDTFVDALWLEDGLSKNTLEAYRRDMRLFAALLEKMRPGVGGLIAVAAGAAEGEKIRADADRQREIAIANAYRDAQKIKGEGDAEAARQYAEAFGRDPQFAQFYRSLEAYKGSFNKKSDVMVLDPSSSDFFKVFRGSVPASAPAAPRK